MSILTTLARPGPAGLGVIWLGLHQNIRVQAVERESYTPRSGQSRFARPGWTMLIPTTRCCRR